MVFYERPPDFNPWFEVTSCLCEYDGKILLLKRVEGKSEGGKWGVVGGKIDAGETIVQALRREVREEIDVELNESDAQFMQTFFLRTAENKELIWHLHRASFDQPPQINLNLEEHTEFQWVTLKEALEQDLVHDIQECLRHVYGLS